MKTVKFFVIAAAFIAFGLGVAGAAAGFAQESSAPLTREEILKQGPPALEKNCTSCHLADKWEGTSRDRNGWAAIVAEMSKLMDDAKMPHMNDKTFNLIVDYLALTRPQ